MDVIRGISFPKNARTGEPRDGYVCCLRTTNVQRDVDWTDLWFVPELFVRRPEQIVRTHDVLISTANSLRLVGKVCQVREMPHVSTLGAFISLVRTPTQLDPAFVYFQLTSAEIQAGFRERASTTTNISNFSTRELLATELRFPPLAEQRRIVAKIEELFSQLDAGVEALDQAKTQLTRYRQAVLKHAFEGKLTEAWREAHKDELEPAAVLLERIKVERENASAGKRPRKALPPLDTSELPELPKGWVWSRIAEVSLGVQYGYTAKATHDPVGPRILRITDIQDNTVNWDTVPYCEIEDSKKERYLLQAGDLVFARTGATVGKSYLLSSNVPDAVFASYLIRIQIAEPINRKFVYGFFQSHLYWEQIGRSQVGIGQPNVNGTKLTRLQVPIAPLLEQEQIVREMEGRLSAADAIEGDIDRSLRQAQRLRQSILKRAFEGKLVPQDPNDEPAQVLLERIKVEKARREAEGKARGGRGRGRGRA